MFEKNGLQKKVLVLLRFPKGEMSFRRRRSRLHSFNLRKQFLATTDPILTSNRVNSGIIS